MSEAETGNLMGLSLAFLQTEPDKAMVALKTAMALIRRVGI